LLGFISFSTLGCVIPDPIGNHTMVIDYGLDYRVKPDNDKKDPDSEAFNPH
jgi:hypothetical protein